MKESKPLETKIAVQFQPFADKMGKSGLHPLVIDTFRHYYTQLVRGETGLITGYGYSLARA